MITNESIAVKKKRQKIEEEKQARDNFFEELFQHNWILWHNRLKLFINSIVVGNTDSYFKLLNLASMSNYSKYFIYLNSEN